VSRDEYERSLTRYVEADSALEQANSGLIQARLSVESSKQRTVQVEQKLKDAKYDLDQTIVTAPGDGFVVNLQLRPGMLVGGNVGSVMSFVLEESEDSRGVIVATFDQKHFLLIKNGQYAEVALRDYPGEIFTGRVINTIDMNGKGQLMASGDIPDALGTGAPSSFAVRIKLDKGDKLRLPGGSHAYAAVYTEHIQIAGIPVMFIIRAYSWLNYLL
jgi:multidrug resistance efflux pump